MALTDDELRRFAVARASDTGGSPFQRTSCSGMRARSGPQLPNIKAARASDCGSGRTSASGGGGFSSPSRLRDEPPGAPRVSTDLTTGQQPHLQPQPPPQLARLGAPALPRLSLSGLSSTTLPALTSSPLNSTPVSGLALTTSGGPAISAHSPPDSFQASSFKRKSGVNTSLVGAARTSSSGNADWTAAPSSPLRTGSTPLTIPRQANGSGALSTDCANAPSSPLRSGSTSLTRQANGPGALFTEWAAGPSGSFRSGGSGGSFLTRELRQASMDGAGVTGSLPGSLKALEPTGSRSASPMFQRDSSRTNSRLAVSLAGQQGGGSGRFSLTGDVALFTADPAAGGSDLPGYPGRTSFSGTPLAGTGSKSGGSRLRPLGVADSPLSMEDLAVAMGVLTPASAPEKKSEKTLKFPFPPPRNQDADPGSPVGLQRFKAAGASVVEALQAAKRESDPGEAGGGGGQSKVSDILHPAAVRALVNVLQDQAAKARAASGAPSTGGPRMSRTGSKDDGLPDVSALPVPANLHRIYHTGVSVKAILKLDALLPPEPITTECVARQHVMPLTQRYSAKLLDLITPQSVNMPKLYVIHAWGADFHDLAQALKRHCVDTGQDPSSTWCFLDIFCCNMGAKLTRRDLGTLKDVISSCKHVLVVVDKSALVLTRLWCMYEAWLAVSGAGVRGMSKSQEHLKLVLYHAEPDALADSMQLLAALRVQCSSNEERFQILEDMDEDDHVGQTTLKAMVPVVRDALISCSKGEATKATTYVKNSPRRYVLALTKLAMIQTAVDNHWEAEKALRQILQLSAQQHKLLEEAEEIRHTAHLASCMLKRGFLDEAERLAVQAQTHYEDALDGDGNDRESSSRHKWATVSAALSAPVTPEQGLAGVLLTLAQIAMKRDDLPRAESCLDSLLNYQSVLAPSPTNIGRLMHAAGQDAPASPSRGSAGIMQGALVDEKQRDGIQALCLLAELHCKTGQVAEAEQCLRDALKRARKCLGQTHLVVADVRMRLATLIHNEARAVLDDTEDTLNEARRAAFSGASMASPRALRQITSFNAVNSDSSSSTRGVRAAQVAATVARESTVSQLIEAGELAELVLKVRQDVLGKESVAALEADILICQVLLSQGKQDKAETHVEKTLSACEHQYGASHLVSQQAQEAVRRLRDYYIAQGQAARRMMDDSRAEELLRKALHITSLVWSEVEEKQITRELQEMLRRQGRRLEPTKASVPAVRLA